MGDLLFFPGVSEPHVPASSYGELPQAAPTASRIAAWNACKGPRENALQAAYGGGYVPAKRLERPFAAARSRRVPTTAIVVVTLNED